jgi:hypothetical protein
MVDEAHALGAIGPDGRGAIAQAGLEGEIDVVVGTLGKALGSYGAYVCADDTTVRYLINTARALIFSTAPPPPAVAAALAALEILKERPHRVERLQSNARVLRRALALEGFPVPEQGMHIVPLIVGEERVASRLCHEAIERGVFAQAIRPPTVPAGTSRLRLAAMASHTPAELQTAAGALGESARAIGLDPADIGPPVTEREIPTLEPVLAEPELEPFIPELEPDAAIAALEAELDAGRERLAAAVRSRSPSPFDAERMSDTPVPRASPSSVEPSVEPSAPFDFERETAAPRAA